MSEVISIVIPAYDEGDNITRLLTNIRRSVEKPHETVIVVDSPDDSTVPPSQSMADDDGSIQIAINKYGDGALNALKTGFETSRGDVVCVVMADNSDDVTQIEHLAGLVRSGAAIAAPSRYMSGGRQVGGPLLKKTMSRLAGVSLRRLAGLGTHDPTNNFKAYSREFLDSVTIESDAGFEVALELTTKAHLAGLQIVETPTTWTDRTEGQSQFAVVRWLPAYLKWYFRCIAGSWSSSRKRREP